MIDTNGHEAAVDLVEDARLEVLPSGVRIIRLGPGEAFWLEEYQRILLVAAEDFLKRARIPGTPAGVLTRLTRAVHEPYQAVWLVLDPAYRLIGFAWVILSSPFAGPPVAVAPAVYLYPRKRSRGVFPVLVSRMIAWSAAQGAVRYSFETSRDRPRAWARIGFRPASVIYESEIGVHHGQLV
jgi:GNAT superfamily N-acetyltransferase